MSGREQWGSRHGFLLATIGSAVGLGNIWRFSYVAGENGGAAFLLSYLVFVTLIGVPLVIAELSLGRRGQGDVVTAYAGAAGSRRWGLIGWIGAAGATLILSYYAVIAGWALKYFLGAATGGLWSTAEAGYGGYFRAFIARTGEPVLWQAVMLGGAMLIVAGGVQRGIEVLNRWLMPVLAVLVLLLAGYALTLPGSAAGVSFLLAPDWSAFGRPATYAAALGQAFFSIGVGMAVLVTYGSYLSRTIRLPSSAVVIVGGDTIFAIAAGLAIFPVLFAIGGDPAAGPELAFITLPQIFLRMPAGMVVGTVFFFLLTAAALTSMVSLLEVPVAVLVHRLKARRRTATLISSGAIFLIGLPSALSFGLLEHIRIGPHGILDAVDTGVSNLLLPVGGLLTALFVGWRVQKALALREADLGGLLGTAWLWLLRIAAPLAIVAILIRAAGSL